MKLISMVDFILEQGMNPLQCDTTAWIKAHKYAEFLKQPLELWMFVPCDDDGNVLKEPKIENMPFCSVNGEGYDYAILKYQQAKERCLFEGFEVRKGNWLSNGNIDIDEEFCQGLSIESLVKYNLELTPIAQKQIGCDH